MANYTVKKIDEMEGIYGGSFKRARAELGIESFGMQVIDMPPNADQYPEHDHSEDGQEEVYLALRGSAEIEVDGDRHTLDPDTMVRVGPGVKRKIRTGRRGRPRPRARRLRGQALRGARRHQARLARPARAGAGIGAGQPFFEGPSERPRKVVR